MENGDTWTLNMLEAFLSIYQTLVTIITFFAGFVFATIPVVLFAVELSSVYGKLIIYFLLASLLIFTIMIDLYHSATMIIAHQTRPALNKPRKAMSRIRLADLFMGIAMFFALASISFMLLLKGQEWTIEAIIWFLISIARPILGHLLTHRT
jgi:uncharacterized membrane protein